MDNEYYESNPGFQPRFAKPDNFVIPGMAQFGIPQSLCSFESMSFVEAGVTAIVSTTQPATRLSRFISNPFAPGFGYASQRHVFKENAFVETTIPWLWLRLKTAENDRFINFYGLTIRQEQCWPKIWIATRSATTVPDSPIVRIGTFNCIGYRGESFYGTDREDDWDRSELQLSNFIRVLDIFVETLAVVAAFLREITLAEIPPPVFTLIRLARLYLIQCDYERLKGLDFKEWANETKAYFSQGESGHDRKREGFQDWDAHGISGRLWQKIHSILERVNARGGWEVFYSARESL